jgi:hypothetical protein
MDFQQAEKKFKQLKGQFEAGTLSETEFKSQLEELMVQDEQGTWWIGQSHLNEHGNEVKLAILELTGDSHAQETLRSD